MLTDDRFRPRFHFTAPSGWINDPNGLVWHGGRWHLHYQHNPHAPRWGAIHWGHASSADLVHWRDEPIAFGPSTAADAEGCFSGSIAIVDGLATAYYTGYTAARQVQCLATSTDLQTWTKQAEPILADAPEGVAPQDFRDPFVFRHDGAWLMLVGASLHGERGQVLLYRSDDGRRWHHRGALFAAADGATGTMWECPNLLRFGDRWVLTVSVWPRLAAHAFVGRFDGDRFVAESHAVTDPDGSAFAHLATAAPDGRTLQWAWIDEQRDMQQVDAEGWAGALSVPRELRLDTRHRLCSRPAAEIDRLRLQPVALQPGTGHVRQRFSGRHLDIQARFELVGPSDVGLVVLAAPDGRERTRIVYRPEARRLVIERAASSIDAGTRRQDQQLPLTLDPGEALQLRVLVDASVIEIDANERVCLSSRVYPALSSSLHGEAFADGPGAVELQVWEMGSIYAGRRGTS